MLSFEGEVVTRLRSGTRRKLPVCSGSAAVYLTSTLSATRFTYNIMTNKSISCRDRTDPTTASQAESGSRCSQTRLSNSPRDFKTRIKETIDSLHEELKRQPKGSRQAVILDLHDKPSNHELVDIAADSLAKLASDPTWVDAALYKSKHLSRMSEITRAVLPNYSFASSEAIDDSAARLISVPGNIVKKLDDLWSWRPWETEAEEGTFGGEKFHAVDFGEGHDGPATNFADEVVKRLSVHAAEALAELPDPRLDDEEQQERRDTLKALSMPESRTCNFMRDSFQALYPVLDPSFYQKQPIYTDLGLLYASLKNLKSKVPEFPLKSNGSEDLRGAYEASLNGKVIYRCPKEVVLASRNILGLPSNEEMPPDAEADRRRSLVAAMSSVKFCKDDRNALQKWEAEVQARLASGFSKQSDGGEERTEGDETMTGASDGGVEQPIVTSRDSESTARPRASQRPGKPRKLERRGHVGR
jgi:hypothetical protein